MKVSVYNIKNEAAGKVELDDKIFGAKWNPDLVHQVVLVKTANKRQILAHAKTRSEVRGGGKKPWRQKGTGRARHGSTRSPIWAGGGVTFGPTKDRNYEKKINKKMVKIALYSVLSKKVSDGELKIIDDLKLKEAKTKTLHAILTTLKMLNVLAIPTVDNKAIYRACANIPKTKCLAANSLNVIDLLKYKNILIEKEAIKDIK
ncbi:MAG: 50S ribosomal protein L4 [Patescibacteria group bacterium]